MRTFIRFGLVWVGLGGVFAAGQGAPAAAPVTTVVMPPAPLLMDQFNGLPEEDDTPGSVADANAATFNGKGCVPLLKVEPMSGERMDGGSCLGLLKEDGLLRYETSMYHHRGGSPQFQVFAEQFADATDALSAYTFYRSMMHGVRVSGAEAALKKSANEMSVDGDQTLVWAGTAVLGIRGSVSNEELIGLTAGLPKESGRRGLAPILPSFIPAAGLDVGSVKYAVGPVGYQAMGGVLPTEILGFDKSAEVATASYKNRGTLTLLLYPTPQIAGERGRAIQDAVNQDGAKYGTVAMRRIGPLVAVTTGTWTAAQAKAMVDGVHLNEEVTFDRKMPLEFHAEIRKTASLLQNIAIFSGILIVGAILLGLFLGGARAGIRKLQGKPAHSEPEFLTISLRESETEHFEKIHLDSEEQKRITEDTE